MSANAEDAMFPALKRESDYRYELRGRIADLERGIKEALRIGTEPYTGMAHTQTKADIKRQGQQMCDLLIGVLNKGVV